MQKITLIGNLGKDPETRFTSNNVKVVSFSVAVKLNKDTTVWYECAIWEDKLPPFEKVLNFLKKGSKVCLIGDLGAAEIYQTSKGTTGIKNKVTPFSINLISSGNVEKEGMFLSSSKENNGGHSPSFLEGEYEHIPF